MYYRRYIKASGATDEEMIRYYKLEQQAQAYAWEFWQDTLCSLSLRLKEDTLLGFSRDILPLFFLDADLDKEYEKQTGEKIVRTGQFTWHGDRQAHIEIQLSRKTKTLNKTLQRTIRHELCHYALWLAGYPCDDDSVTFWFLAAVMDAQPYMIPENEEAKKLIKTAMNIYNEYVKDMLKGSKEFTIGMMLHYISTCTPETYESTVLPKVKDLKAQSEEWLETVENSKK